MSAVGPADACIRFEGAAPAYVNNGLENRIEYTDYRCLGKQHPLTDRRNAAIAALTLRRCIMLAAAIRGQR